jgi:hypothetical protein
MQGWHTLAAGCGMAAGRRGGPRRMQPEAHPCNSRCSQAGVPGAAPMPLPRTTAPPHHISHPTCLMRWLFVSRARMSSRCASLMYGRRPWPERQAASGVCRLNSACRQTKVLTPSSSRVVRMRSVSWSSRLAG